MHACITVHCALCIKSEKPIGSREPKAIPAQPQQRANSNVYFYHLLKIQEAKQTKLRIENQTEQNTQPLRNAREVQPTLNNPTHALTEM